jgi:hypothetical protein
MWYLTFNLHSWRFRMFHVPMCLVCNAREVEAPFSHEDGSGFCSVECEAEAFADDDNGRDDFSDDADVLASAGWGTDEDYGYYGNDF